MIIRLGICITRADAYIHSKSWMTVPSEVSDVLQSPYSAGTMGTGPRFLCSYSLECTLAPVRHCNFHRLAGEDFDTLGSQHPGAEDESKVYNYAISSPRACDLRACNVELFVSGGCVRAQTRPSSWTYSELQSTVGVYDLTEHYQTVFYCSPSPLPRGAHT